MTIAKRLIQCGDITRFIFSNDYAAKTLKTEPGFKSSIFLPLKDLTMQARYNGISAITPKLEDLPVTICKIPCSVNVFKLNIYKTELKI